MHFACLERTYVIDRFAADSHYELNIEEGNYEYKRKT